MQCVHPANAISKSLTALREFVYNSTEDTPPTVNIPISEMKKAIAAKRITIVGGNENWVKKLRQEFLNWKFVSASVSSAVDNMSILKAERVILFTDTLGHSNYCDTSKVITNKPKKMRPGSYCPAQNVQHKILRFHRRMRFFPSPYQACFSAPGLKSAARLP